MQSRSASFYSRLTSCACALAVAIGILAPSRVHAYGDTQWEWHVSGITGTWATKAEAYAALLARGGNYAYLDREEGISDISAQWVYYKYSVTPRDPEIQSDWDYWSGSWHSASEQEHYDKIYENIAENYSHPNCPPILEAKTGWITDMALAGIPYREHKDFDDIRFGWSEVPVGHCVQNSPLNYTMIRDRDVGCDSPFGWSSNLQKCTLGTTGFIYKRPLTCSDCNTRTKNPADVATGDKTQRETDYSGPALTFWRQYHSLEPHPLGKLGAGWTHNFNSRLLIFGGSEKGIVTADGSHEPLQPKTGYWISATGSGLRVEQQGTEYIAYHNSNAREIYASDGRLLKVIAPSGQETTVVYDASNRISEVVGHFGHRLTFDYYASSGLLHTVTDPAGETIEYVYGAANNLVEVRYPDGTDREYHYEDAGFPNHLTGITDQNGDRHKTIGYDATGRVVLSELAGGQESVSLSYAANSTTVTDAASLATTYSFTTTTTLHRVLTGISKGGFSRTWVVPSFATDSQRRPTQLTDERGLVQKFAYNANHRTSMTEAFGTALARTTAYSYLSNQADLPTQIDHGNRRTTLTYFSSGNVQTRTVTDLGVTPNVSRTWTYTYNGAGQVLTVDGPRTDVTDVTTYTYYNCSVGDECGQVETITNALGHVTTYNTYNEHGQPLTVTDPNGVVTTLTYDDRQRVTSRSAGGETTAFAYWPTGLLKKVTLPDTTFLEYTYDAAHRLTEIEDSEGNRIVYTLDDMSNRIKEETFDPSSFLVRLQHRAFNTLNQLWKEIGSANTAAVTTTFGYDGNGNQTSIVAPLSRNTASLYDELNRLKQITDPASGVSLFGYDANDNLTSVTDPRSKVTSYAYNGFGDLKQLTSPDTGVTDNVYDTGGNLSTSTDARGKTGTRTYDALNRSTQLSYPDQTITYTYDTGTNNKGRLMQVTDGSGSTSWTYTNLGRVASRTQVMSGVSKAVGYGYNTDGQLTTLTTPSGQTITYAYASNRIAGITVNSTTLLSSVLYDPFGPARQWTWGNASLAVREFDQDGNVDQIDSAGLRTYAQDDAFRITGITDTVNSALSWTYGYDLNDRLNSASKTGQSQTWTYDANGNRLTQGGSASSTYTIASTNNRLSSVSGALSRTYSYDAAGNTTGYSGLTFGYNDAGRLTSISGSATASYGHNALGQRVKKTTGGVTTYFVYDEAGHLIGEYDGSGVLIQETLWMEDIPVATLRPNGGGVSIYYVHTDHLNTPRRISRPSDDVIVWRWDSDPFGTDAANQDPDGDATQFAYGLRFPGQYFDAETGLSYNYFRDYDPAIGRYVESDPIGLWGGMNTYVYVKGNVVRYVDSLGLDAQMCARRFFPAIFVPVARHCYLQFDGKADDTSSFDTEGVHKDPAPKWYPKQCVPVEGKDDDDCLKREMKKCEQSKYDFTGFNCCHCVEQAMKACGAWIPQKKWPNWPVNPGPAPPGPPGGEQDGPAFRRPIPPPKP